MLSRLNPLLLPGATSLRGYFRPARSLTLLAAMEGSGAASPPTVTMSGAGLSKTQNVELDFPVGGARGTAEFRWRQWGGAWSSNILTAASVDLSAQAIAVTLAFNTGTYDVAHVYRSVASTLVGAAGNTLDGESGAAAVRPYIGTLNGRPSLRFDGVAKRLRTTTSTLPVALIQGEDTAFTLLFAFHYHGSLTPANNSPLLGLCDGSASDPGSWFFGIAPGGEWTSTKRGSTGASINVTGGTADNSAHIGEVVHAGTTLTVRIDGTTVINAAAQDADAITGGLPQFLMLGGLSTPGTPPLDERYADVDIGDVVAYAGALSATQLGYLRQNLKLAWGL